jgi:hypothetical protein
VGHGCCVWIGVTMALMATLADRILDATRWAPLDDDVLAKRLGVAHRQSVNQAGPPSGGAGPSPAVHRT